MQDQSQIWVPQTGVFWVVPKSWNDGNDGKNGIDGADGKDGRDDTDDANR